MFEPKEVILAGDTEEGKTVLFRTTDDRLYLIVASTEKGEVAIYDVTEDSERMDISDGKLLAVLTKLVDVADEGFDTLVKEISEMLHKTVAKKMENNTKNRTKMVL